MSDTRIGQLARARELAHSGATGAARQAYRQLLEDQPGLIEALLELGALEREQGQFETAIALHRQAAHTAADAPSWTALGRTLADAGRADDANKAFESAFEADANYAPAYLHCGELAGASGNLARAAALFEQAKRLDPKDPFVHHNLGVCAQLQGKPSQAGDHFRDALKLAPQYWRSWQALGDLCRTLGDFASARTCHEHLVALRPEPENLLRLGAARQFLADYDGAIELYEQVLTKLPGNEDALYNLGTCYLTTGQLDRAEAFFRQVLHSHPGDLSASAALAGVYDRRGEYDRGLALLQPLIPNAGANAEVWVSLGRLAVHAGAPGQALEPLEHALADAPLAPADRSRVAFAAGATRDATGDYERAFEHFRLANSLIPHTYDRAVFADGVAAVMEIFSREYLHRAEPASDDARPVFIVGMPRSGSTLVERILAAHPDIETIGESPRLSQVAFGLGSPQAAYPACIAGLERERLASAAGTYLEALPGAGRVIDKMLSNLVHVGLISLLFGNARIVHCSRHPLDIALSCYRHDFAGSRIAFAYDLDDFAHYYRLYDKVMRHWEQAAPVPIFNVVYENMVTRTEETTRALLEFLDLPFASACLAFHEEVDLANTASYAQVRRPIYLSSIGRYRHYARQLQGVAAQLSDLIDTEQ